MSLNTDTHIANSSLGHPVVINKGHSRAPGVAAADYVNTSSSLRSAVGLHFSGVRKVPVDVSAQARYM